MGERGFVIQNQDTKEFLYLKPCGDTAGLWFTSEPHDVTLPTWQEAVAMLALMEKDFPEEAGAAWLLHYPSMCVAAKSHGGDA